MKIYYICECCDKVFDVVEAGVQEGAVEARGICEDCALEMGLKEVPAISNQHYYN